MMAENLPVLANDKILQIQIAEHAPNRIQPKKSTPRHKMVKFLKTEDKKNLEHKRKTTPEPQENNSSNDSGFLIRNRGVQPEAEQYFPSTSRRELSAQNAMPCRITYQSASKIFFVDTDKAL